MDLQANPVNEILYVSFNQDFTCFVCGTESGFRVYSTDPFHLTFRRDFEDGSGLGVICMLFRTNILAFSGGGKNPRFQPHKVVLWDDRHTRVMAELSFKTTVKSVRHALSGLCHVLV
ncbi:ATG18A [Symbiodinium pilosum]|uniref:ATG18A protein n=1 Tax=Symbiodinium pilosum TaxID=2952 RepID=A0A812LAK8_SYMPI|nr:ATG18A [Symbiodinium pilosum]